MRKAFITLAGVALALGVFVYHLFWRESPDLVRYQQVQVGMTVDEVQAILGPGVEVPQREVPGVVWAVNPADEQPARQATGAPSTARNYPTYIRPKVNGDYILQWVNGRTRERILVAFQDGKVCEKDYFDPNHF